MRRLRVRIYSTRLPCPHLSITMLHMNYAVVFLCAFAAYILFCKAWPYFLYPNYFRKSKVEDYPELKKLASELKGADTRQTIENVYAYMQRTYTGFSEIWKIKSLLSVFQFGDFSTRDILGKRQFLWCHTQNRLFKSILVHTGSLPESAITIRNTLFASFFIHQWISIELSGQRITIDPHCGIYKTGHV